MAQADSQTITRKRKSASVIHVDPRASAKLRAKIETAIDKLVDALDAFDSPSDDLEEQGDEEPYLAAGATGSHPYGSAQDEEEDAGDEGEPDHENEPSLGSATSESEYENQELWARGDRTDLEDGHDGSEPSLGFNEVATVPVHVCDGIWGPQIVTVAETYCQIDGQAGTDLEVDESRYEPDLGSLDRQMNQTRWALGRDGEPSLGSVGAGWASANQEGWAAGARDDREQDSGDEPEIDHEDG
jgi:hypothetical protein